ncbi:Group 1 glycosyl transferase [Operophtera brumata]|uniref:Group 1 glycosyl transferase n=1 Tax=Operophtera brumata TaxID=104452 RepID=A0A0L7LRJ2_OPEBR|nr:Group 1 glycosyl transferase [Operophtera brumata]
MSPSSRLWIFGTHPIKFLIKQYTANSVASLRPRSGLILGSMTCGDAASAGTAARTSGVAVLMTGTAPGRVPDACGAIVAGC